MTTKHNDLQIILKSPWNSFIYFVPVFSVATLKFTMSDRWMTAIVKIDTEQIFFHKYYRIVQICSLLRSCLIRFIALFWQLQYRTHSQLYELFSNSKQLRVLCHNVTTNNQKEIIICIFILVSILFWPKRYIVAYTGFLPFIYSYRLYDDLGNGV